MTTSLLSTVRANDIAVEALLWPGDFDLDATEHVEEVVLASGERLEPIAGDGSGGTYFLCGEGGDERPVLYADSEGQAGLLAVGLPELIGLLLVVPWWRDCPGFTVEESREAAEEYLADEPAWPGIAAAAAEALGLRELPTEAQALARLREVAIGPGREAFTLLNVAEGGAYEQLFRVRG
ncbi:hypothetical protein ACWEQL_08650 [Kitasatospora sp. NPDC004240]